jgi:hypothetical protein
MKSLQKSRLLNDKPHLWKWVEALILRLEPDMKAIYGTNEVATKALELIDRAIHEQHSCAYDTEKAVMRSFLLTSFMAKNGSNMKGPKLAIGDRLKRIEERLEQLEKALEDDSQ